MKWSGSSVGQNAALSLRRSRVRVSSRPPLSMHPQINWIDRLTTDQKVGGSNPFGRTNFKKFHIFIGVVHFLFAKLKICDIINLFSRSSTVWQCTTLGTQGSQVQILSSRPFKIYQGNLVFLLSKPLVSILVLFEPPTLF